MMKLTASKRLLIGGAATAAVALGIGGVAFAAGGDDPGRQEQGYVTIVENPTADTPAPAADRDCPEKGGSQGAQNGAQGSAEGQA
ncbi:hypothetical protein [Kribbella deserti]|uniref:Uncharacterized protein n=1 Tax=Kribbella deserti TaxID=1926257 RepID=A0ABV6QRU4_9ACTN